MIDLVHQPGCSEDPELPPELVITVSLAAAKTTTRVTWREVCPECEASVGYQSVRHRTGDLLREMRSDLVPLLTTYLHRGGTWSDQPLPPF